jgi:hypothetical protein
MVNFHIDIQKLSDHLPFYGWGHSRILDYDSLSSRTVIKYHTKLNKKTIVKLTYPKSSNAGILLIPLLFL